MQIPKRCSKAFNFLFTFEQRDAYQQAERVGSCENLKLPLVQSCFPQNCINIFCAVG